jgi:hypothetical protein
LYSSRLGGQLAHLVGVQATDLDMLETVLVCPLKEPEWKTSLRPQVRVEGGVRVVVCELVRPIRRSALTHTGWLDAADSRRVMAAFKLILAG